MCGIGFWYNKNGVNSSVFKKYMDKIIHRGPDNQQQILIDKNNIIGNNRLAIIDNNPRSNQPFNFEDLIISFNGAIYNYQEIKKELTNLGHTFLTESDTEVIIHAYMEYGASCVNKFEGMWAFVIYDKKKELVFCSRDRLGIKPLYYYSNNQELIISSEVKQFKEIPSIHWKMNKHKVHSYLSSGGFSNQDNQTFIQNIFQLEPGNNLIYSIKTGSISLEQYYSIEKKHDAINKGSLLNIIKTSVEKRLIGDQETSVMLSGGLDSSIISYHLLENKKSINSYSFIEPRESSMDESDYIKEFLLKFPHENNQVVFPDKIEQLIKECIYYQDEPPASLSTVAQFLLYKLAASRGERLMLSGQGADELFGGYPRFLSFIRPIKWLMNPIEIISNILIYGKRFILNKKSKNNILNNESIESIHSNQNNFKTSFSYTSFLMQKNGLRDLLHYEDRNSMSSGIETRLPFLDTLLINSSRNMKDEIKFKNAKRKGILLHNYKNILPGKIINRRNKMAFDTPEELLLKNSFFNANSEFQKLKNSVPNLDWNESFSLDKDASVFLKWQIYFLNIWIEEFHSK